MSRRILIGVIVADCHIDFQCEILRGIITQAYKGNCDVAVISPLHNFSINSVHKDAEKTIFDLIFSDSIDGIIYDRNSFHNEEICKYIDGLCKRSEKPVMLLDHNDHKSFETTSVDDLEAFETITDHLINVHGY
ncbi:MAG TPA: diguanylate cyclase, partial [Ruminococcus sp.]|nr:diguanylate cyclase [Ruminococcus sp.]